MSEFRIARRWISKTATVSVSPKWGLPPTKALQKITYEAWVVLRHNEVVFEIENNGQKLALAKGLLAVLNQPKPTDLEAAGGVSVA